MSAPAVAVPPELKALMRRLKLGQLLHTLPERAALARQHDLSHLEFLEQLLCDEAQRRDTTSAGLRPGPPTSTRPWCSKPGTTRPRSPTTGPCGASWSLFASSNRPTTSWSWGGRSRLTLRAPFISVHQTVQWGGRQH